MSEVPLRLVTRGSALAMAQARNAQALLRAELGGRDVELVIVRSTGDKSDRPFAELPSVGVFVKELEEALLSGRGDVAVHSLKDLPTVQPPGLVIGAVLEREDARDALIARHRRGLAELPPGAVVATSSPRRQAQLRRARPDLRFVEVRGNVDTRIAKLERGEFDAIVLALAGLRRLGRAAEVTEVLPYELVLPAPGQGAVALETRADSPELELVRRLEHAETRAAIEAERSFLLALGGGCSVPVGARGRLTEGELELEAVVAHPATGVAVRGVRRGRVEGALALGQALAGELAAGGAREILAALALVRPLAGRRVLVTRGRAEDDALRQALSARGAEVVSCPAIEIVPPADPEPLAQAARRAATYDWVVFTSANAVSAFAAVLAASRVAGAAPVRAAVVGPATARVATEHGFDVQLVAEESSGEGLGRALATRMRAGECALFPRARDAGRALPQALERMGIKLEEVEAYRTQAPAGLSAAIAAAAEAGAIDAIAFASPSAVRNFLAAAAPSTRTRLFAAAAVACIGPTTAAAAREAGLSVSVTAASASSDELAEALSRHLGGRA